MYIVYICKYFFLNQIQEHFFGMSKQFSWLNQDWCRFTHLILSHFSLIISTFVSPCCLTHPIFFKQQVAGLNMFSNLNPFFFFARTLEFLLSSHTHKALESGKQGQFFVFSPEISMIFLWKQGLSSNQWVVNKVEAKLGRTSELWTSTNVYISFFWWRIGLEIQNSKWMESRIGSKFKNDIFAAVHPAVTSRVPAVLSDHLGLKVLDDPGGSPNFHFSELRGFRCGFRTFIFKVKTPNFHNWKKPDPALNSSCAAAIYLLVDEFEGLIHWLYSLCILRHSPWTGTSRQNQDQKADLGFTLARGWCFNMFLMTPSHGWWWFMAPGLPHFYLQVSTWLEPKPSRFWRNSEDSQLSQQLFELVKPNPSLPKLSSGCDLLLCI